MKYLKEYGKPPSLVPSLGAGFPHQSQAQSFDNRIAALERRVAELETHVDSLLHPLRALAEPSGDNTAEPLRHA